MSTTWVLLLSACLSGEEIWVYVENDPQVQSQHIRDALHTPIAALKAKFPSPACQRYLWELSCLRHDLREQCTIHFLTRDEAQVSSDVDLPGYAFTSRDNPVPLHPDVYLHWQLVPEHLKYLSQIKEYDFSPHGSNSAQWTTKDKFSVKKKWFVVFQNSREYLWEFDGKIYQVRETVTETRLRFSPAPHVDIPPLPKTVTRDLERVGSDGVTETGSLVSYYRKFPDNLREIVEAVDMGTGIINQNKEQE